MQPRSLLTKAKHRGVHAHSDHGRPILFHTTHYIMISPIKPAIQRDYEDERQPRLGKRLVHRPGHCQDQPWKKVAEQSKPDAMQWLLHM